MYKSTNLKISKQTVNGLFSEQLFFYQQYTSRVKTSQKLVCFYSTHFSQFNALNAKTLIGLLFTLEQLSNNTIFKLNCSKYKQNRDLKISVSVKQIISNTFFETTLLVSILPKICSNKVFFIQTDEEKSPVTFSFRNIIEQCPNLKKKKLFSKYFEDQNTIMRFNALFLSLKHNLILRNLLSHLGMLIIL